MVLSFLDGLWSLAGWRALLIGVVGWIGSYLGDENWEDERYDMYTCVLCVVTSIGRKRAAIGLGSIIACCMLSE